MDSSKQNWLGFSLSNQYLPSSHFSLLQAFNNSPSDVTVGAEENGSGSGGTTVAEDLTMVNNNNNSPKLADFLGSGGQNIGSASNDMSGETSSAAVTTAEMYESELKTIAASFLRGYSAEQQVDSQKQLAVVPPPDPMAEKKVVDTFGQRTSIYRGVTRHRWTGRYEAHLWDNTCRREGQSRKGRQVYLGGYDKEDKAARAYDLAALKYWGPTTTTNFPIINNYEKELEEMKNMTRQEFVASLRRRSSGFSRGASIYRGVTRHHQHGRWQARIGRVAGNKDLYLGTFSTQEEAAEAYDIAAIKFRGLNAVTNFDMSRYDVKSIATSNLPIGGMTNKAKTSSESVSDNKSGDGSRDDHDHMSSATSIAFAPQPSTSSTLGFGLPVKQDTWDFWSSIGYNHNNEFNNNIPRGEPTTIYQTTPNCTSLPFNLCENNKHHGFYDGDGDAAVYSEHHRYQQQQQQEQEQNNVGVSSNQIGGHDNPNTSYGKWISPSLHSFQSAKPNLSVIHTAIFGIE